MRHFFCLLFSCLFFIKAATAQHTDDTTTFTVNHYTDEDGLPQNSIKDIFQDEYGFIWMTTEGGVVRFDGRNFRVFDKSTLSCIRSNRFNIIVRIPEMGCFAITEYGRRVQIRNGFAFCPPGTAIGLSDLKATWNLFPDTTSFVTTGLPQKYLLKKAGSYIIPFGLKKYINCGPDYVYFRDRNVTDTVAFHSRNDCRGFFTVGEELYYLQDSCLLTAIQPGGARSCSIVGDILADKKFRQDKSKFSVFWNLAMRSTVFYYNRAFYEVDRLPNGNLSTRLIYADFDIASVRLKSHYYDKANKRLFLGSETHGLFVLKRKSFSVLAENKVGSQSFYAVGIYDSASLVTPHGILLRPGNTISLNRNPERNMSDQLQIQLDRFGNIWTKSADFVFRSDKNFELKAKLQLPGEVTALYCSMDDTSLWIGMKRSGLFKLRISGGPNTGQAQLVSANIPDISFMASESKERLWIGSAKGLYLLNTTTGNLSSIDQFKNKNVRSILVKAPGELWITTYGDGIFLLRNNRLNHMPYDADKSLYAPHCMVLDQHGFFWISTNKGLIKASRKDLIAYADQQQEVFYQYFGKESGFYSNEFNGGCQPCGSQLPGGLISFPSLDGLVQIDPDRKAEDFPDGELIIDKVTIDDQLVVLQDTIMVPRKFDNLSVALSTVYFGNRKNLQIDYMLLKDHKEDQWYPVKENNVSFSALASGTYELRLRKIDGFGRDNYKTVSLTLIVPYAFYETVWFKLLVTACLLLLVYAYIRIRLYFILQRNRLLDLQIARRTRTLTNTLRALKVSEASLRRQTQMQEMLIGAISHDIKSPMKYLTMVSRRMQQQLRKKDYESLTAFNESIQDTAGKVYAILDNLVTYIGFQLKGGRIRKEAVDIFHLVEDKINLFSVIASTNNTELRNTLTPGTLIEGDETLLAVIIHNLIDNAVKFTANGRIEIYEAGPKQARFVLVIKDTGTGIPEELVRWLNTKSENGLNLETIGNHKGMGLIIIKELLAAASADIYVLSGTGGTTISMYFNRYTPPPTDP
ncbi:MAG: hypothetical protein JNL13_11825 [Chitinophagaceae bacterium]|nr:hypothetical protein [Chitinophagaceae bacterium]